MPTGLCEPHFLPFINMQSSEPMVQRKDWTLISNTNTPGHKSQVYYSIVNVTLRKCLKPSGEQFYHLLSGANNVFHLVLIHLPLTVTLYLS